MRCRGGHKDSLIRQYAPNLLKHGSTNDERSDGGPIKLAQSIGATVADMDNVALFPNCFSVPQLGDDFKVGR